MTDLEKDCEESTQIDETVCPAADQTAPVEDIKPTKKTRALGLKRTLSEKQKEALARGREARKAKYASKKLTIAPLEEKPAEDSSRFVAPAPPRKYKRQQSVDDRKLRVSLARQSSQTARAREEEDDEQEEEEEVIAMPCFH